jgi:hypothetical protein
MALEWGERELHESEEALKSWGPCALFFIEISDRKDVVVYTAERDGDVLRDPFVDCKWGAPGVRALTDMSQAAKQAFFGCRYQVRRVDGKNMHQLKMDVLPKHFISMHLKKGGSVRAKVVIDKKEATVRKVYVDVEGKTINYLVIHAVSSKMPVTEKVVVTDEMRAQYRSNVGAGVLSWLGI